MAGDIPGFFGFFQSYDFEKVNIVETVYEFVCPLPAISQKPGIVIKFDMVTASVTGMHHVLIILTLTFTQGHTGHTLTCSIISKSFQAIPIKFSVKIVRQKVYTIFSLSDDLDLTLTVTHQGHNCVSKLTVF